MNEDEKRAAEQRIKERDAALDALIAKRDCAKEGHRFALRQSTGLETCIDCYAVEEYPPK